MLLPDGSGLDVIAKVNSTNKILIVVLSAYDQDDLIHAARMLDIDAYMMKPVQAEEFLALLRTLLIDYQS
jgi:DNA-binding response OmpR family regulator